MPFIGVQPTATAITATSLNGVTSSTAELNILDGVTSTAAELNILDGVTSTAAELNILDGVTSTAAELNYLDITTLGGSEASKVVTADSSGNVGIGTASPSTSLDIVRAGAMPLRVQSTSGTECQINMVNTGGNVQLEAHSGNFSIDADNVGIGTTSPAVNLHVNSASDTYFLMSTSNATADNRILFRNSAGTDAGGLWYATNGNSMQFRTNSAERMRIDSSGNVGIGTTSPSFNSGSGLEISRANTCTLRVENTGTGASSAEFFAGNDKTVIGSTSNTHLQFRTNATERMRINSTGVVQFENGLSEKYTAVTSSSNATTVDLLAGTNFSHTLTENTTFTFSNPTASGRVSAFTLKLVQDSSASGYTVTWPSSVDWPSATAPTLTATANAVDYFVFITHDGGTNYYGFTAGQALG